MSQFTYAKIGQYSEEVVKKVLDNKGKLKAVNGKTYTIDISKGSTFDKFKAAVEKQDYLKATDIVKESQFEILEPSVETRIKHGKPTTQGRKKWLELGWTEIEKKEFSSPNLTIDTDEQETISLKIFEAVLGKKTKTWKTFSQMYHAPGSEIAKIFPELPKLQTWWDSFELQFNQVTKTTDFPNSKYDVYLYGGKKSFMDYSTELVTKEIKFVGQKDTWNPADVWLLKSGAQAKFKKKVDEVLKKWEALNPEEKEKRTTGPIQEINALLRTAYNDKEIVGISLKKLDKTMTLKYDLFNMNADETDNDLPDVTFDGIKLDCSYDTTTHKFNSKTSYVFVKDGPDDAYKMAYKSNTGKGNPGNITYEFLPSGKAAAQLGKVPKESLKKWLESQVQLFNIKGEQRTKAGLVVKMPEHSNLEREWSTDAGKLWEKKVKFINSTFTTGTTNLINGDENTKDSFVKNLKDSYNQSPTVTPNNASMMQMVDFTWILAKLITQTEPITKKTQLQIFLTRAYYFAQKRGVKYNFGPFGKLYSK